MSDTEAAKRLFFQALALLDARDYRAAESRLRDALNFAPQSISILTNLSIALMQQKRPHDALSFAERAIEIDPRNVEALLVMANCHAETRNFPACLATCDRIIGIEPRLPDIHIDRAAALNGLHRYEEALVSCDQAIALQASNANAHVNRGNALLQLRRVDEALLAYDNALRLSPNMARAWAGRGHALARKKQYDGALAAFARAIELDGNLASAWLGRGDVLAEQTYIDEALSAFTRALESKPDLASGWLGRGNALALLERFDEAIPAYDRAMALDCDLSYLAGERLNAKMHLCEWQGFEADCRHLLSSITSGKPASVPFSVLAIPSSPADQLKCAETYVADSVLQTAAPLWRGERYQHRRIRIAYLSPDFREHAISHLAEGLFRHHDRSRFEITAISFGPDDGSEMRERLMRSFDHFSDVRSRSDRQVAELIREMEIDIAVDLCGYTRHARPSILAQRPAPVQVSYLGYPGTMGTAHIDYLIADRMLIPQEHRAGYSERIVYVPDSYQVNNRESQIAETIPTRSELGLPAEAFVFCCFNNTFKITPDVFDIWMRLLREVEGSVLWLRAANASAMANLRQEAGARGVSPDRVVFAPRLNMDLHLARHRQAGLFLDTFFYGAHTTASDALWAGLPVVTCCGATYASRVAASLLRTLDMTELITFSPSDYENLALKLACDPAALAAVREKLRRNRQGSPLFDTVRFTRHLELAYRMMWERYQQGHAPEDISVPAAG